MSMLSLRTKGGIVDQTYVIMHHLTSFVDLPIACLFSIGLATIRQLPHGECGDLS